MKLIDKAALVDEINKRIIDAPFDCYGYQRVWAYNDVKDILKTLEVKEVDLDKEVIDWWNAHYSSKAYTFEGYTGHYIENSTLIDIAKHFFELGMSVSNKAQKNEG